MRNRKMRHPDQRGQAAMEFVLILLMMCAFAAVLFQGLLFERDVFNKSLQARYKILHDAREDQDETEMTDIDTTFQGKNLEDILGFEVPIQEVDGSLHYGPKTLHMKHGTKYWDPLGAIGHSEIAFFALLTVDHYEPTSGHVGDAFDFLHDIIGNLTF
jgi:hypothetical protein